MTCSGWRRSSMTAEGFAPRRSEAGWSIGSSVKSARSHCARSSRTCCTGDEVGDGDFPPVTRKRKHPLIHTGVMGSDFVSDFVKRVALERYRKHRAIYRFACSIAPSQRETRRSVGTGDLRHHREVDAFLDAEPVIVGETAEPEGKTAAVAPDDPPPTGWRPVAYDPLGVEAPPGRTGYRTRDASGDAPRW